MVKREKFLNAVAYVGFTILIIGVITFILGMSVSGFSAFVSIGIGTSVGAVFIFLIGVFLVVTEEMLEKSHVGKNVVPITSKKGTPMK
ncbi:hypothetical protein [Neobacillus vireti]|uniref:hypothetical protein n=1 Tax=Neobacillus vireti TaxID=220686 RepID=UPI002FFFB083